MASSFSFFQSAVSLAHHYWDILVKEGDIVVDATCGNGKDSLFLAKKVLPKGTLIGIDLQEKAIESTSSLLEKSLSQQQREKVFLFLQSHETFPEIVYQEKISLFVYNLGYLPGGDKELTTLCASTLPSIQKALQIVHPGGALSITCYPGHEEGAQEESLLKALFSSLSQEEWNVCHHIWSNRRKAPSLFFLQKKPLI